MYSTATITAGVCPLAQMSFLRHYRPRTGTWCSSSAKSPRRLGAPPRFQPERRRRPARPPARLGGRIESLILRR